MATKDKDQIKDKIAQACKEVVLQEEVVKLKQQLEKQLGQARQLLIETRQQTIFWENRIHQLSGSLAACNAILTKSQKTKALELERNNTRPKEK